MLFVFYGKTIFIYPCYLCSMGKLFLYIYLPTSFQLISILSGFIFWHTFRWYANNNLLHLFHYNVSYFCFIFYCIVRTYSLLFGRKAMTNLDSILKNKNITLPTKVCIVKAMVFPVVTYGCESWTIRKAECPRIDAFKLWCWWRLLRVPCTIRRPNQSILNKIDPEYSLEGLILKLNPSTLATWWEELTH